MLPEEIPRLRCNNASTLTLHRFRLVPVRSPLLGDSLFAFFSSRYLDVSVPEVRCRRAMYSLDGWQVFPARVVPFGDLRIKAC